MGLLRPLNSTRACIPRSDKSLARPLSYEVIPASRQNVRELHCRKSYVFVTVEIEWELELACVASRYEP